VPPQIQVNSCFQLQPRKIIRHNIDKRHKPMAMRTMMSRMIELNANIAGGGEVAVTQPGGIVFSLCRIRVEKSSSDRKIRGGRR